MKKIIFLLPILIQSAFALNDSGTETNPYLVVIKQYFYGPVISYDESGITLGVATEDAFGVPYLNDENSAEVNRIINEVKDDIIKPASISGHTVLMKYRNFKNQELIDFYNKAYANRVKKVHDEVNAQKKRRQEIASAIINNQNFQNHYKCSSSYKDNGAIFYKSQEVLDDFQACLNYINFDTVEFKKLLSDKVSEAKMLQLIMDGLLSVSSYRYAVSINDFIEQYFDQLKKENMLKKTCRSPRTCYIPSSTKETLTHLFQGFYNKDLPGKWTFDLTQELESEEFKSLNITEDELKDFQLQDKSSIFPTSFDFFPDSVEVRKIFTASSVYSLRMYRIEKSEELEYMLESAKTAATKEVQGEINTWLKSLKGNDVAEITDTKINDVGIEQYKEERKNSPKLDRHISKETKSSNADQL